jgi:putative component of membrane protein insertase Oxa1/YidC/SpoIIIJ protein YidD
MQVAARPRLSPGSRLALRLIRTYQQRVSPRFAGHCRYEPSCSSFALLAYQSHGFLLASRKTLGRLGPLPARWDGAADRLSVR